MGDIFMAFSYQILSDLEVKESPLYPLPSAPFNPEVIPYAVMQAYSDPTFLSGFGVEVNSEALLSSLGDVFQKNKIPIHLTEKVCAFQGARLHFKIDDSSSMQESSNLLSKDLSRHMKNKKILTPHVSRWVEAQDRLHVIFDIVGYIPLANENAKFAAIN
jgi:hypothetical protein